MSVETALNSLVTYLRIDELPSLQIGIPGAPLEGPWPGYFIEWRAIHRDSRFLNTPRATATTCEFIILLTFNERDLPQGKILFYYVLELARKIVDKLIETTEAGAYEDDGDKGFLPRAPKIELWSYDPKESVAAVLITIMIEAFE